MSINFLKLLHLADSAFPIGALSHSFGLETLAAEGFLRASQIEHFLADLLVEIGKTEALFCRIAHRCHAVPKTTTEITVQTPSRPPPRAGEEQQSLSPISERAGAGSEQLPTITQWLQLNHLIAASKSARESRTASATLGRRFLQTVAQLEDSSRLQQLYRATNQAGVDIHYCAAFGLVGGFLALDEDTTTLAYLQQSVMGMVSACQRLLPIGQGRASEILWRLKPVLVDVAQASREPPEGDMGNQADLQHCFANLAIFTPLVDLGSMRHPTLSTRLFIS